MFAESEDVQELIQTLTKHWNGKQLMGVNKDLKWVPMSDYSMPYWTEENPDWEDWKST